MSSLIVSWLADAQGALAAYGVWGLVLVAFTEAICFPIPPDAILLPLALTSPQRALWYALICTLASTAGGLVGRQLGLLLGRPLLARLATATQIDRVDGWFQRYGGWAVGLAALTPIPYKVFTIAAGVFYMGLGPVLWGSLLGRGVRFFLEGGVVLLLGSAAPYYLNRYLGPATLILGTLVVLLWLVGRRLRRSRNTIGPGDEL